MPIEYANHPDIKIIRTTPINGEVVKSITEVWNYKLGYTPHDEVDDPRRKDHDK